jgi:hypothetical protein
MAAGRWPNRSVPNEYMQCSTRSVHILCAPPVVLCISPDSRAAVCGQVRRSHHSASAAMRELLRGQVSEPSISPPLRTKPGRGISSARPPYVGAHPLQPPCPSLAVGRLGAPSRPHGHPCHSATPCVAPRPASTRAPDQLPAAGKTRPGARRSRGRPRGSQERFNLALEPAADGRARQPLEIVRIADR